MNIDDQIDQLRELAESKGETLFEIAFRNAGVGFIWHDEAKAGPEPEIVHTGTPAEEIRQWTDALREWTRKGLVVHRYYLTIGEAIEAETLRLTQKEARS